MLFEIINNTVENILLSSFIAQYLKLNQKKYCFIFITVFINTFLSTILADLNIEDFRQTLIIQLVLWACLYIFNRDFTFQNIMVSLFGNILLVIAVYFSNLFLAFLLNASSFETQANYNVYIIEVILGKTIFLILILITLKIRPVLLNDTETKSLNHLLVGEMLILALMAYYFVSYVLSENFNYSANIIFLCFLLLFFSFCYIFNQFIKMNKIIYENKLKEQEEKYMHDNLKNLKSIKYEIDNIEHRMNYILQSIEYDLYNKNYNQALEKIKTHKEIVSNVSAVFCTQNEIFDFMMNLEMKFIIQNHKKIKVCTFILQNPAYNQLTLSNRIIDILKYLYTIVDEIELFLTENKEKVLEVKYIIITSSKIQEEIEKELLNYSDYNFSIENASNLMIIKYSENLNSLI